MRKTNGGQQNFARPGDGCVGIIGSIFWQVPKTRSERP
jgi:hypothetical protein